MSLLAKAVDRLFRRMAAAYGAAWDRSLGTAPIDDVKAAWAHELSGFSGRLDDLAWALDNLPERCPNAIEFRTLARKAPEPKVARLEAPPAKADPARAAAALARLRSSPMDVDPDHRGWARRILERRLAGEKVTPTVYEMARSALTPRREPQPEDA
ncbi:MAG: hypothetical protein FWC42_11115 [Proteobacteria bacterium]|nr:hypothetical protein [Pseudomonadota bacterium]